MQQVRLSTNTSSFVKRVHIWYVLLCLVNAVFGIRLFYLQIIKHDYYKKAALRGQLKEYDVPAERGIIEAHDGNNIVPLVLNEKRYTLFADPKFIKDPIKTAQAVQGIIGGDSVNYETKMKAKSRYAVLAKKLTKDKKEQLDKLNFKGIGTREES